MRKIALLILLVLIFRVPFSYAWAQDAVPDTELQTPATPELGQQTEPADATVQVTPDASQPAATDGPYRILAIGDGLAGGLGAGLGRLSEGAGIYEITNRFNEASGIARPEVYDWAETVQKITEDKQFDAVVVLVGSNDRQDIRLGQFRYQFGTSDWLSSYTLQVDTLLDAMVAKNMQIFWISVPPMADQKYDSDMKVLNGVYKDRVAAKGGHYLDIRPAFLAADGSYTDRGPDDTGTLRKLRSRDGVTFYKEGNNRMAQLVLAAVEEQRKPGGVVAAAVPDATPSEPAAELSKTPILGQSLGGGGSETIETTDIAKVLANIPAKATEATPPAVIKTAVPQVATVKIIDAVAASGSASEKFLTTGVAPTAPAGRFDDYSMSGN